ncbi:MAG: ligand-binding sensor domain-containing protein [Bacteroidota bacterium]
MKEFFIVLMYYLFLLFPVAGKGFDVHLISIEEGLSQTYINCILQDSRGFLWIGTQDGLNKYTGKGFHIFHHQPLDTNSLSNGYIRDIIEDNKGNLWIATNGGLNMYNRETGNFTSYLHDPADPGSISDNTVYSVVQTKDGTIWALTSKTLEKFDEVNKTFLHYTFYNNLFNFVSLNASFDLLEDSHGMLWIATKDGLNYFDRSLEIFERYSGKNSKGSLSSDEVRAICEDKNGQLWIGTDNGINLYNREEKKFNVYYFERNGHTLKNNPISDIFQDNNGCIWILSQGGIIQYYPGENQFEWIEELHYNNLNYASNTFTCIEEDNSSIMWIGSLLGIIKYDKRGKKFTTYRNEQDNQYLTNNTIASVFEEKPGILWVGTWGQGLTLLNRSDYSSVHYSASNKRSSRWISNDFVHVIFRDSKNNILVGTRDGLNVFDLKTRRFSLFCHLNPGVSCTLFKNNRIFDIIEDASGDLWFATSHGLHKFERESGIIRSYFSIESANSSLAINTVYSLLESSDGTIWIGTENGLISYVPESDAFFHYEKGKEKNAGLSSNSIYYLHEDDNRNIWIGTASGLNKLDILGGRIDVFTEKDGLPNNLIYAILDDEQGNLWMSTNRGLVKFDPIAKSFRSFDISDGLQSFEYNLGAVYKSESGELFFGGLNGLNAFYPDSIQYNEHVPEIAITSFELFTPEGVESICIEGKKIVYVPHDVKLFSIEFASLDFTEPSKNLYSYKMFPVDEESKWIDLGNRNMATFSSLPPGEYIFRVKGSNNDLIWNEEGQELRIIVEAAFWQSRTAYISYSLVGALMLFLVVQARTRNLRRSNRILREKELASIKIARQKEELILKNKNITDSINYAKRIQEALLPSEKAFAKILKDSFVLHKPKDIVSGDFYWINEVDNKIFLAAVDCTGHGVPGAFMSIIGFELFRRITNNLKISNPAEILKMINEDFEELFNDVDNITLRDGMDIAFSVIDKKERKLTYAGAFNPIYLIRENKIIEVKGERFSVGLDDQGPDNHPVFKNHEIEIQDDDVFYMFSDGYADQFGGPDGKKFKYRRFRHLLLSIHKLSMSEQKDYLNDTIEAWKGHLDQVDDILILGFRPGKII